jgi:hypothetical protein
MAKNLKNIFNRFQRLFDSNHQKSFQRLLLSELTTQPQFFFLCKLNKQAINAMQNKNSETRNSV